MNLGNCFYAGDITNLEHIQPFAKVIANGLPLAINVIGASMRGKRRLSSGKMLKD